MNNTFFAPEQLSAATKASMEAQFSLMNTIANKAFENIEKIIELNMSAAKASLEEANATTKQLLSAKDPQEFLTLASTQTQPNAEKIMAYARHLSNIASQAQAEITETTETQISETSQKVLSLIDELTKNAPAGSEHATAFIKSAINNTNATYEQLSKITKQASEALENNVNSTVGQFTKAASKTAKATTSAKK